MGTYQLPLLCVCSLFYEFATQKRKKDRCGSVLLPFSLRGILRRVEHVSKKGAVPFLLNTLILYRGFKKSC